MVTIKGEVKGLSKPVLTLAVSNAIQGSYEGHLTPKEAIALAHKLLNWGEDNLKAEDV